MSPLRKLTPVHGRGTATAAKRLTPSRLVAPGMAVVLASAAILGTALPAVAADAVAPVVDVATLTPTPEGNNNWRFTPATLNLSATDDVAVDKFQYSLDAGLTYIDVQVADAPSAIAKRSSPRRATRRSAIAPSTRPATSPPASSRTRR